MSCRRATSATVASGASNSARTRRFSSGRHRRRRSTPVIISTADPAPVLKLALKSVVKISGLIRCRKATVTGRILYIDLDASIFVLCWNGEWLSK
jgi:hypothetical protein